MGASQRCSVNRDVEPFRLPVARIDIDRDQHIALDDLARRLFGQVATTVRRDCCRCLKPFDVPMEMDVDLRYLPQVVNMGESEYEISEDDLATAFYRDDQIDLGDMAREQLQLASPMKPLCREDCLGLCHVCGVDRNAVACGCDTAWHDPRLEGLRKLLLEPKDKITGKD